MHMKLPAPQRALPTEMSGFSVRGELRGQGPSSYAMHLQGSWTSPKNPPVCLLKLISAGRTVIQNLFSKKQLWVTVKQWTLCVF